MNNKPELDTSVEHGKAGPRWLLVMIPIVLVGLLTWGVSISSQNENCSEPRNPYSYLEPTIDASERYAGWQWGEKGNNCSGNSNSFIQGCEEYEDAESVYEACLQ